MASQMSPQAVQVVVWMKGEEMGEEEGEEEKMQDPKIIHETKNSA